MLKCILAGTASLSAIVIPLFKESNDSRDAGSIIAFSNFAAYICVAIFGNMIGSIMNLFTPENIDGKLIYSREAYLAVWTVMFLFGLGVLFWAFRIKETYGKRIYVK